MVEDGGLSLRPHEPAIVGQETIVTGADLTLGQDWGVRGGVGGSEPWGDHHQPPHKHSRVRRLLPMWSESRA